jgi:hypothetical protein
MTKTTKEIGGIEAAIKKVAQQADEYYHGLTDRHVAALFALVEDMYGFKNVKAAVNPTQKEITLSVLVDDKEIIVKPKTAILDKIKEVLGLTQWTISFSKVKNGLQVIDSTKQSEPTKRKH